MKSIKIEYSGGLRTLATHPLSGEQLITDAPPDNNGKVKILRYGKQLHKIIMDALTGDDSDDYGEFIDSKISLNWQKRSYEFGIFYQPHNQAGGISFSLYGFK